MLSVYTLGDSHEEIEWLLARERALPCDNEHISPSVWAETKRYLPQAVTPFPGYYSFDVTPYLREIVDCFDIDSPIREISGIKGVQLGFTVGLYENVAGYLIDEVKTAPAMLMASDDNAAQDRLSTYISPMIQHSGLQDLIKSSDEIGVKKKGKTSNRLEWIGGGSLTVVGAVSANNARMRSIQFLLRDEIDTYADTKQGNMLDLSAARTNAFAQSRKIGDISTPLIKQTSLIDGRFARGDQRYYYVRCLKCGYSQVLRWRRKSSDGVISGIVWELQNGILVPDSVRYLCKNCGHAHANEDKTKLLASEHGAVWKPTATPVDPSVRSYHLSGLYSPPGMYSWQSCAQQWLDAWDVENNRPKDNAKLQVFYNNVLAKSFEAHTKPLEFSTVSKHRRNYVLGTIPNNFALQATGSKVALLTCAVDVQKEDLSVAIFGWCRDRRAFLVDYWVLEGSTANLEDETWQKLAKIIEEKTYLADDGLEYSIAITVIDSGSAAELVYDFAEQWDSGVYPIKGREQTLKSGGVTEFSEFKTQLQTRGFSINVDYYKDRWDAALRRGWDEAKQQPIGQLNLPMDLSHASLKELTVETRRKKVDKATGKVKGFYWHRPQHTRNELWDLLVYSNAALDILAWGSTEPEELKANGLNWDAFYDSHEEQE